jgi:uncharacterized membrane protein SirB2
MYLAIKHVHMSLVTISISLFVIRLLWRWCAPARLAQRWVKVVPHLIDTLLLASGVTLMVMSGQWPWVSHWLAAKLLALLVYIVAGYMALKGKSPVLRLSCAGLALLAVAYILRTAVTKVVL